MVKTREVGGPTDIAGHPLITRFHSLHPTIEDIAFAAAEAGMSNYTEGNVERGGISERLLS